MPKFLEKKLRQQYGDNPAAIYGTMNKIGAMRGNKETAKGREMEAKHKADMKKKQPKSPAKGKKRKTTSRRHVPKSAHDKKSFLRDLQSERPKSTDHHTDHGDV